MAGLTSRVSSPADGHPGRAHRAAGALLAVLAAFVALPSANYLVFAGIPFDSLPQYLVLVALAPFAVWPWLRHCMRPAGPGRRPGATVRPPVVV